MQSGTTSSNSLPDRPSSRWAEFIGTAIALFTLILPLLMIAQYSPPPASGVTERARN